MVSIFAIVHTPRFRHFTSFTLTHFFKEIGSQTNDYDLTKMALTGRQEHKIWRDEVGGPFIEVITILTTFK